MRTSTPMYKTRTNFSSARQINQVIELRVVDHNNLRNDTLIVSAIQGIVHEIPIPDAIRRGGISEAVKEPIHQDSSWWNTLYLGSRAVIPKLRAALRWQRCVAAIDGGFSKRPLSSTFKVRNHGSGQTARENSAFLESCRNCGSTTLAFKHFHLEGRAEDCEPGIDGFEDIISIGLRGSEACARIGDVVASNDKLLANSSSDGDCELDGVLEWDPHALGEPAGATLN